MVEGKTVHVLQPQSNGDNVLFYWQAYLPDTIHSVNITVAGCNIAGSKDQASKLRTATVKGGVFMFTAFDPYGDQVYQLCTTDMTTGVTTPLLPDLPSYPRAYASDEVSFFDNAVLYTSAGGSVDVGDSVACLVSDPSAGGKARCHWVNDELQQSTYLCVLVNAARACPGYHSCVETPTRVAASQWFLWVCLPGTAMRAAAMVRAFGASCTLTLVAVPLAYARV